MKIFANVLSLLLSVFAFAAHAQITKHTEIIYDLVKQMDYRHIYLTDRSVFDVESGTFKYLHKEYFFTGQAAAGGKCTVIVTASRGYDYYENKSPADLNLNSFVEVAAEIVLEKDSWDKRFPRPRYRIVLNPNPTQTLDYYDPTASITKVENTAANYVLRDSISIFKINLDTTQPSAQFLWTHVLPIEESNYYTKSLSCLNLSSQLVGN